MMRWRCRGLGGGDSVSARGAGGVKQDKIG